MKTMYRAYCGWRAEIETFDVVKETAKTVVYQQQHYYCGRERGDAGEQGVAGSQVVPRLGRREGVARYAGSPDSRQQDNRSGNGS